MSSQDHRGTIAPDLQDGGLTQDAVWTGRQGSGSAADQNAYFGNEKVYPIGRSVQTPNGAEPAESLARRREPLL